MRFGTFASTSLALALVSVPALAKDVPVSDVTGLLAAVAAAQPGDRIVLADGTYAISANVRCQTNGTAQAPITVAAKNPLGARIESSAVEGFKVTASYWTFEGLDVKGVCSSDDACEHAFHVSGAAKGVVLRKNRIVDFNAQLKVNAEPVNGGYASPDDLLVEGNELFDTRPRNTSNPTTKLNIDTGDRVVVRANYIHDFQKGGGDGVSYGAFMKSGGKEGLFERNLVVCSDLHNGATRIGLSLGGGGTGAQFCAPAFDASVPCDPEHTGGTIRNNVIASCSDVGIYLNKAKDTKLLFNTLVATAGIDFRYASSTGIAVGNVLDGKIRGRDGGTFTGTENLESFTGFEAAFVDPKRGNLKKKGDLSALLGKGSARPDVLDDYCARRRAGAYDLGAQQLSLGDCASILPPEGPSQPTGPGNPPIDPVTPGPSGTSTSQPPGTAAPTTEATPAEDSGCSAAPTRSTGSSGEGPAVALLSVLGLAFVWKRRRG